MAKFYFSNFFNPISILKYFCICIKFKLNACHRRKLKYSEKLELIESDFFEYNLCHQFCVILLKNKTNLLTNFAELDYLYVLSFVKFRSIRLFVYKKNLKLKANSQ